MASGIAFIEAVRKRDGLLGVAVDPVTSHEWQSTLHGNSMA